MSSIATVNASNVKDYVDAYIISGLVYDYLNKVPKSPKEATKRYNYQKMIRTAINTKNKPKATILAVCKSIARDHVYCEEWIKKNGKVIKRRWEFDWETRFTKEEAPMWGNYDEDGTICLEEAMSYMLYNRMKPYLIDNKKDMLFDRCVTK